MTVALAIGLLDVLTVHADAIKSQGKVSACQPTIQPQVPLSATFC